MVFAIIADWNAQFRVSRYNLVETATEAAAIVDRLRGIGLNSLPPAKQAPNAYFVLMPPAPPGTASFQHRARFWKADPGNGTVSFDTVACHTWQSKVTSRSIDAEADKRIDKVFSPDDPARAGRVRTEMPEGAEKIALFNRVTALRTAAQALKDTLVTKTPEEILKVMTSDNQHWPE